MGRHAKDTSLIEMVFGKSSGWAKYGINTPIAKAYYCSDCYTAGVVLVNKKTGSASYSTCECVGDSEKLLQFA
jgi:hypothetical protein